MIRLQNVCGGYPGHPVLRDVTLSFLPGEVLAITGPNGCGKSTLLRTANGLLAKSSGEVFLDEAPLEALTPKQIARKAAYLPQARAVPNITARRMVLHGRFPYLSYPRRYREEDYEMVQKALCWVGAEEFADRPLAQLSGGQRQKVYLAMALAQDTETILMDEPTTYLDISCQLEVMALSRRLAEEGKAVVLVLHDLCLALQYAHRIAVMENGRILQTGTVEEVYSGGQLEQAMGIEIGQIKTPTGFRYYYK